MEGWSLDRYIRESGEKKGITPREAWDNRIFDEIMEFRVKDIKGFQLFFSTDSREIYDYFVKAGVEKFIPWTSYKINDEWNMCWGWEFKFKRKKQRKAML